MAWSEKDFEEKMQPKIDTIYHNIFGKNLSIKRSVRSESEETKTVFMDKELAIDTYLMFKNGSVLTLQEKTLRSSKQKYQHFTFEYYNNPDSKDPGEWFKLAAQIYFFGYANKEETDYTQFWLLDILRLRLGLNKFGLGDLCENYLKHNRPPAKANFFAIPFSVLENMPGCVMKKYTRRKDSL